MEFLDKLVLPQSAEHIQLLHYLIIVVLSLSLSFLGVLLCGTILSYNLKKKGVAAPEDKSFKFAVSLINIITLNKSAGLILGILPVFSALLIYIQLLQTTGSVSIIFLVSAFVFITFGVLSAYTYKYAIGYSNIFSNVETNKIENPNSNNQMFEAKTGTEILSNKSGKYAVVSLLIGTYFYIAGITIAGYSGESDTQSVLSIFGLNVFLRYIEYLCIAFVFTGASILFAYFVKGGNNLIQNIENKDIFHNSILKPMFVLALILPLIILVNLLLMPKQSLSNPVFFYTALSVILLLFAVIFIYSTFRDESFKISSLLFVTLLFVIVSLVIKDQIAISNVTQLNSVILSAKYDEYLLTLKGDEGTAVISGAEVYQVRCSSCHKFDVKLVGPPYKQTLPKYEGNENKLIQFILNPQKINPEYPSMPNPGLKPNEAKAVAKYILENYKK